MIAGMAEIAARGRCWAIEFPAPDSPNRFRAEVHAVEGPDAGPVWMTADELEAFAAALLETARVMRVRRA